MAVRVVDVAQEVEVGHHDRHRPADAGRPLEFRRWGYMHLHDPLAVGLAVDASLAQWQPARIAVGESGQTRRAAGAPNCRVAHAIDTERFLALFFDRLCPASS